MTNITLEEAIKSIQGSRITEAYNKTSEVYQVINNKFEKIIKPRGSKANPHTHSKYSNEIIGASTTSFLAVKESYTEVQDIVKLYFNSGMDFVSLADHNTIKSYPDLMKYGRGKAFLSCEYDVAVIPQNGNKTIHIGVWGLDYPTGEHLGISYQEIIKLHNHLMQTRIDGPEEFKKECKKKGLDVIIFNHPSLLVTPQDPLTANEIDACSDIFDYIEVNGDLQKENIFALELALEKNKILVAGDDRHTLRPMSSYTETLREVNSPYEFLQEVRIGHVGIGSYLKMPHMSRDANAFDVIKSLFNGSRTGLYEDIYRGFGAYFKRDNGWRKWTLLSALGAVTAGGTYLWAPLFALPLLSSAYLLGTFPINYGWAEKKALMKRVAELHNDYLDLKLSKEQNKINDLLISDKDKKALLGELIKETNHQKKQFAKISFRKGTRWWEKLAKKLIPGGEKFFTPYYNFSIKVDEE
ncbi:MAG: hypothetical protein U9Q69_01570 [Nanoarchaeota archaeon]|nr:hypothetical protein [Nanoarchaeota archaeon]